MVEVVGGAVVVVEVVVEVVVDEVVGEVVVEVVDGKVVVGGSVVVEVVVVDEVVGEEVVVEEVVVGEIVLEVVVDEAFVKEVVVGELTVARVEVVVLGSKQTPQVSGLSCLHNFTNRRQALRCAAFILRQALFSAFAPVQFLSFGTSARQFAISRLQSLRQ